MCGRYSLALPIAELEKRFGVVAADDTDLFQPNDNAAPTQSLPIITEAPGALRLARWGLVPGWAKDLSIGNKMTNARAETLDERASFRNLIYKRRCLVPAEAFFEWKPEAGGKQPYRIAPEEGGIMAFAGLYDVWKAGGEPLLTYTIITTAAHGPMSNLHDRMPLILSPAQERQWLDAGLDKAQVHDIIESTPRVTLAFAAVSKAVNKVRKATSTNQLSLFDTDARNSE